MSIQIPHYIDTIELATSLVSSPETLAELLNHIGFQAKAAQVDLSVVRETLHDENCAGRFFLAAVAGPLPSKTV